MQKREVKRRKAHLALNPAIMQEKATLPMLHYETERARCTTRQKGQGIKSPLIRIQYLQEMPSFHLVGHKY